MESIIFLVVWIGGAMAHTLVELYLRREAPPASRRKASLSSDRSQ